MLLLTNAKIVVKIAFLIYKLVIAKNVHQIPQLQKLPNAKHAQKILFLIQVAENAKSVALGKLLWLTN